MKRLVALAAATMFSGAALAQMAPVEPNANIDASARQQLELQEPDEANLPTLGEILPDVDTDQTGSIEAEGTVNGTYTTHPNANHDANTLNSENLRGR